MGFAPAQDEWPVATGVNPATGAAVTPGNLAIARAIHRSGSNGLPATITDNGGNTWHPVGNITEGGQYVGVVAGGSGDLYYWYCVPTAPFTSVSVTIAGDPAINRILFVREWAGNAATDVLIDDAYLPNPSMTGPLPAALIDNTVNGALVSGALGATVSTRTFTILTPGYTAGREHRAGSSTLISASNPDAPAGVDQGPQWELGGTASTTGVITAAFRPAGTTPPPGPATGTAITHATWDTTATGRTTRTGTATTTHTWQATATGTAPDLADHTGTATAPHTWQTSAAGARESHGRATVEHTWDARAAGVAPDVDAAAGSASARHRWGVTAAGARPSHGTATARHRWAPAAAGRTSRAGSTRVNVTWATSATGTSAEARDITLTVLGAAGHPLTAHGTRTHPLTITGPTGHPLTVTHVRS